MFYDTLHIAVSVPIIRQEDANNGMKVPIIGQKPTFFLNLNKTILNQFKKINKNCSKTTKVKLSKCIKYKYFEIIRKCFCEDTY